MNKFFAKTTIFLFVLGIVVTFFAPQTSAQVATSSGKKLTAQEIRISNIKDKADKEIERRLNSLSIVTTRIQAMKKISEASKSSLISQAQDQTTNLTSLKAKIDADTDLTTLLTDTKSITIQYRFYMLFIPKTHILAASDRFLEIADDINQVVPKLQTRVDGAKAAGKNVTVAQTALTDIQTKVADIKVQAQKAQEVVTPLVPDQGSQFQIASNKSALQSALKNLQTARQDLVAIVKDIQIIKQTLNNTNNSTSSATLEK